MREIVRPLASVLSVACLAFAILAVSSSDVLAQAKMAPAPKQQAAPPAGGGRLIGLRPSSRSP